MNTRHSVIRLQIDDSVTIDDVLNAKHAIEHELHHIPNLQSAVIDICKHECHSSACSNKQTLKMYLALNLLLQLVIRKMRKVREVLFIHRHHVVIQISQLSSIRTRNNRGSLLHIIKLRRQAVVDETAAVRIDRVGVRVVRVVDIANTVILHIRGIRQQGLEGLGGLHLMRHRGLHVGRMKKQYLRQVLAQGGNLGLLLSG